jgi:hypothetical protein
MEKSQLNAKLVRNILETCNFEVTFEVIKNYLEITGDLNTFTDVLEFLNETTDITDEEMEIINGVIDYQGLTTEDEYLNVLEVINLTCMEDDTTIEFDGFELRIIKDSEIWEIYKGSIENVVTECYDLNLDNIPSFVEFSIDWEQTAKNCYVDGYGHEFSGYDHSEHETDNFWYFCTNK